MPSPPSREPRELHDFRDELHADYISTFTFAEPMFTVLPSAGFTE